jgi:hypothetical protein
VPSIAGGHLFLPALPKDRTRITYEVTFVPDHGSQAEHHETNISVISNGVVQLSVASDRETEDPVVKAPAGKLPIKRT